MKFTMILTLMVLAFSCGKKNESGKPDVRYISSLTEQDEILIRKDFIREGKDVLNRYETVLKNMFGLRTVGLIRNRLKYENVQISERLLMNERNEYIRSQNRNYIITLYAGNERQNLSWREYHRQRDMAYTRLVMHELLLLGEIDDHNFFYTDRVLVPVRR